MLWIVCGVGVIDECCLEIGVCCEGDCVVYDYGGGFCGDCVV